MSKHLRVGVLTGGGDAPGLNAVIRAVTKSLILQAGADVIGVEEGFLGLVEQKIRPLEYKDVSGILTRGGTILGTNNRANPFNYYRRGGADVSAEVVRYCTKTLGMDALIVIGGDGTMTIAHQMQERGLNCIGVPKTIDNDLVGTDRTFGFDTAVAIATDALDRLHTTAQSHHRVMILETMGRYAGWIALHAGTAAGADVILIPELPYSIDEVVRICREREMGGQRFTLICVAEGARPQDGEMVVAQSIADSPDPIRLGGISKLLELQLKERIRSEIRTTVLGHMQRGGTPTAYDRNLATSFGSFAASMVMQKRFGELVALQKNELTTVPFSEVAGKTRTVPATSWMLHSAMAVGTSFGVADVDLAFGKHRQSSQLT